MNRVNRVPSHIRHHHAKGQRLFELDDRFALLTRRADHAGMRFIAVRPGFPRFLSMCFFESRSTSQLADS
jgi:hypothetical protein